MRRKAHLKILSVITSAALAGCATNPPPAAPPTAEPKSLTALPPQVPREELADNNLYRDDVEIVLQLDVYQFTVPCGTVSSSQRFWKHIDEDHVDLATHATLLKNGVRFGVAPNDDWPYFKSLMDQYGATVKKGTASPVKKGSLELPLRSNIEYENIFYLDPTHSSEVGRTYENCDNLLAVGFEPTPRRPGDARIALSAMVRGLRKEFVVTPLNETRIIERKNPEFLYDLRIRQDVPLDHFLVIAPAKMACFPDSLGQTFFINPGGAEPTETVMLLVPRPFRLAADTTSVPLDHGLPVRPQGK